MPWTRVRTDDQGVPRDPQPAERGQYREARRCPDEADRKLNQGRRERHVGHALRPGAPGEVRIEHHDAVAGDEPQKDREVQAEHEPDAGMAEVDYRLVAQTSPGGKLDENLNRRAERQAEGQSVDAERQRKDNRCHDDAGVVDGRRQRRQGKRLAGVKHGGQDARGTEEHYRGKRDPREADRELELVGIGA